VSDNDRLPSVSKGRYRIITAVFILIALVLAAFGVLLVDQYFQKQKQGVALPEPFLPRVQTLHLVEGTIPAHVEATGFLVSPATVRVPVETNGKLLEMHRKEGDVVVKGDPIARIDAQVWNRRIDAANAREASLNAQLDYIAKELEREKELERRGSGRKSDQDRWLSEKRRIDAALLENGASRAEFQLFLAKCDVVADRDGVWYEDIARVGEYLTAGQPLGLLRQVDRLELEIEVAGRVRLALSVGESVVVELLDVDTTLTDIPVHVAGCFIATLPAGSHDASRRFPVVISVPNVDRRLIPGLFARVRLELPRKDPLVLVPKECVINHYGRKALYVVEASDGELRAALRFVDLRSIADRPASWRVDSGVAAGDVVIVSPIEQLIPGIKVEVEER
jgi:RND family efflux transporter MFP subunit